MDPKSKRFLGKSKVAVTVLGCGGGPLGDMYTLLDNNEAIATVETAYDLGITLFDTSPFYGHGLSEQRFGAALRGKPRNSFVLSTKVGRYLAPPTAAQPLDRTPFKGGLDFNHVFDYTREGVLRSIDQSMARLGLSTIDCLIIHDVDVWTHGTRAVYEQKFKETMDGCYHVLDDLRSQKVIKAIGVGLNEVNICMEFAAAGDFDFFLLAGRYTLLEQGALDDFLPLCEKRNIGIMLGGPYNSGILATGAIEGAKYNYVPAPADILDKVRRIEAVCKRHDVPLAAAALQFPLGHPSVTSMIPGAVSPAETKRNVELMAKMIPAALWAELKSEGLLAERAPFRPDLMTTAELPRPDYARNMRLLGYSDQGGRPDGVQVMVQSGYAYIGHMFSNGFSVVDVRDPRNPKPVNYIPAPPGTWSLHLQAHEDLLLVINGKNLYLDPLLMDEKVYYSGSMAEKTVSAGTSRGYSAGVRIFDISDRPNPREISFLPIEGVGAHRIWYVGGRWAYASALVEGFIDTIFLTIDLADPASPHIAGYNWLPGMNKAAGETVRWDPKLRYACHHGIVAGDTAYVTWRDGGLSLVDVSDRRNPRTIVHRNWCPPYGGGTHNALPLPDRELLVVVDEAVQDQCADGMKFTWLFDIREPTNPISIATMPTPSEIDYVAKGAHFGPHNVHENRPGSFVSSERIFTTYQNAGVRVFDIRNPYQPAEIGALVPPPPTNMMDTRPGRARVIQSADIFVDRDQLVYCTDTNAGLYIMEMTG